MSTGMVLLDMGKLNVDPAILKDGRSGKVVAASLGCSPVTIWRARKRLGIPSNAKRGPALIDRRFWPWGQMSFRKIGQLHGVTGQRAYQIYKRLKKDGILPDHAKVG